MREARIIRELAAQLEDFYREAIARGLSESEADAYACEQIRDWQKLGRDVANADRENTQPRMERIADTVTGLGQTRGRGMKMLALATPRSQERRGPSVSRVPQCRGTCSSC